MLASQNPDGETPGVAGKLMKIEDTLTRIIAIILEALSYS